MSDEGTKRTSPDDIPSIHDSTSKRLKLNDTPQLDSETLIEKKDETTNNVLEQGASSGLTNEQLVLALTTSFPMDAASSTSATPDKPSQSIEEQPPTDPQDKESQDPPAPPHEQTHEPQTPTAVPERPQNPRDVQEEKVDMSPVHPAQPGLDEQPVPQEPAATDNPLPELGAALRRLSGIDPSTSAGQKESQILGNALAAVAKSQRSPTTAMAIGNLAAITVNINNLLNTSDTSNPPLHEPPPASADNDNPDIAVSSSPAHPPAIPSSSPSASSPTSSPPSQPPNHQPTVIVNNDLVWEVVRGKKEVFLGYHLYHPSMLLPNLQNHVNGLVQVRVPARYLTYQNPKVKKRAIWGTGVYTDDSDVVAMILHAGKYELNFQEPEISPTNPFIAAVQGKSVTKPLQAKAYLKHQEHDTTVPDHDVQVTLRVLPKLRSYADSLQHHIKSRRWGKNHDGISFYVEQVEKIKKGEARIAGRKSLKSSFGYEHYRKMALGL
ncbi:Rxt3-domain-containing protein [Hesseltinella vesiculosa]|uniref:Rxt3-domain-containing protein n=1 Tax=Hesseltinella vesiculosa TaxID=101127 RepID=A0A1X2GP33_9FUNG|nr:Rxt3-domain-containing protein [Hesseltinella vesiculosa]